MLFICWSVFHFSSVKQPTLQIKQFVFDVFPAKLIYSVQCMLSCTSIKIMFCSCLKILLKSEWRRQQQNLIKQKLKARMLMQKITRQGTLFVISESSHIMCSIICIVTIEYRPSFFPRVSENVPQQPNCAICRLQLIAKAHCLVRLCIPVFLVIQILVSLQSIFHLLFLVSCLQFSHYILLQKRNAEGGKQGASLNKKAKKDKLVGATGKSVRTETSMVSVAPRVKPELTLPATYVCNSFLVIYCKLSSQFFMCCLLVCLNFSKSQIIPNFTLPSRMSFLLLKGTSRSHMRMSSTCYFFF